MIRTECEMKMAELLNILNGCGYEIQHTVKTGTTEDIPDLLHLVLGPIQSDCTRQMYLCDGVELYPATEFRPVVRGYDYGLRYKFAHGPLAELVINPYKSWEENELHYRDADKPVVLPHAETCDYIEDSSFNGILPRPQNLRILLSAGTMLALGTLRHKPVSELNLGKKIEYLESIRELVNDYLLDEETIARHMFGIRVGASVDRSLLTDLRTLVSEFNFMSAAITMSYDSMMTDYARKASDILQSIGRSAKIDSAA